MNREDVKELVEDIFRFLATDDRCLLAQIRSQTECGGCKFLVSRTKMARMGVCRLYPNDPVTMKARRPKCQYFEGVLKNTVAEAETEQPYRELWVEQCNECPLSGPFEYNGKCDVAPTVTRIGGAIPTNCPIREANGVDGAIVRIKPDAEIKGRQ